VTCTELLSLICAKKNKTRVRSVYAINDYYQNAIEEYDRPPQSYYHASYP